MASCNRKTVPPAHREPTRPVPEFGIRVSLSVAAAKKLGDAEETIGVSVQFHGDNIPLPNLKTAPLCDVNLGSTILRCANPETFVRLTL